MSSEAVPTGYHPHGRLSALWERAVFLGLYATLPFVGFAAVAAVRDGYPEPGTVNAVAWLAYSLVQTASKMPISFRYEARGFRAVLDLLTFAILVAGTLSLGVGGAIAVPAIGWQVGLAAVALGFVSYWSFPRTRLSTGEVIPLSREVFARTIGTLVNLPMVVAVYVQGFGAAGS